MSETKQQTRLALGLRSTAQCLGKLGVEFGTFGRLGVDLQVAASETAAPAALAGLISGDWAFAEIGAVPVVSGFLDGHDPVILLAPEPVSALYVMGCPGTTGPAMLAGGEIGVLSESGQTGVSAAAMLDKWGLKGAVTLSALGTYPAIFDALANGEIAAGLLPADYRFRGEGRHGLVALADLGDVFGFQGVVVATTRRVVQTDPELVGRVVHGYLDTIEMFKSDRARALPFLARHLDFDDTEILAAIYDFYVPRFQSRPYPSEQGIVRIVSSYADRYPAAVDMTPGDVFDLSFLDRLLSERAAAGT